MGSLKNQVMGAPIQIMNFKKGRWALPLCPVSDLLCLSPAGWRMLAVEWVSCLTSRMGQKDKLFQRWIARSLVFWPFHKTDISEVCAKYTPALKKIKLQRAWSKACSDLFYQKSKPGKFLCYCEILFHCDPEVIRTLLLKSGGLLTCYSRLFFHHKCAVKALLSLITGCLKMSCDSRIKRFIICSEENLYSIHIMSSF